MTEKDEAIMGRRSFLKHAAALAIASTSFGQICAWGQTNGDAPLRERAARKGLIYGSAVNYGALTRDTKLAASVVRECGIVVPENELKWEALRPSLDKFDFTQGDFILDFAKKNNILLRGHTLVWHQALPKWFETTVNSQNAEQVLRNHITTAAGHYAGKMHSWDVVNEAIAPWDKDKQSDGMRNSPWYKLLGPKYIDIAFKAAAAADPKAILVLNQDHLEHDTKIDAQSRAATLRLLKRLKASATPVHALGIESHLSMDGEIFSPGVFRTFLKDVAELGLKIMITELDVTDIMFSQNINKRDKLVANKYEEFLSTALQEKAVIGVLTWGLSDKYTWLSKYMPRDDKAAVRPLPLDENFNRKPAWNAIAGAFDKAENR
ncbi:MAG: endo-1,4-beta-xylanase [Nitrospirae bacterium]|nr:endo-1,4-beta-xylanase [Nitrospirota bacterium]